MGKQALPVRFFGDERPNIRELQASDNLFIWVHLRYLRLINFLPQITQIFADGIFKN
jgi:hypothetical protein